MRLGLGNGLPGNRPPKATRGPELLTAPYTAWTLSDGTITADATGIQLTASVGAIAHMDGLAIEDGATYELKGIVSGFSSGSATPRAYGATAAHVGVGAALVANGPFVQQVTCSGAGTPIAQVRFTAAGTATNLKLSGLSCKKVLP